MKSLFAVFNLAYLYFLSCAHTTGEINITDNIIINKNTSKLIADNNQSKIMIDTNTFEEMKETSDKRIKTAQKDNIMLNKSANTTKQDEGNKLKY